MTNMHNVVALVCCIERCCVVSALGQGPTVIFADEKDRTYALLAACASHAILCNVENFSFYLISKKEDLREFMQFEAVQAG